MINFQKKSICEGVNFNSIYDDRFKTGRISATIFLPLNEKTVAANALFPNVLRQRCKKYPTLALMNQRLSELYGASIHTQVCKMGDAQTLTISATGIDDRYSLNKENVIKELTDLLCNILFSPLLDEKGVFFEKDLEQEKRQLIELIDSEYNDKRLFARLRCEELMCKGELSGINRYGKREDVAKLTSEDVVNAWENALKSAQIELIQLGNTDGQSAFDIFEKSFSTINRDKVQDCSTKVIEKASEVREYSDYMDVTQCKLVLGFRAGITEPRQNSLVLSLLNTLYGGTAHSKLFLNVREKKSLCYYCSSRYFENKGIFLVQSGVEKQNLEMTKEEILNQLKEIQVGNFSQEELETAKLSMKNNYRSVSDYLRSLEHFYIAQTFNQTFKTPEELAQSADNITREEIIEAANNITLDTIYNLKCREE